MGIVLGNIIAIYRRELQSYFVSPLAYAIAGIFWVLSGLLLFLILWGPQGILEDEVAYGAIASLDSGVRLVQDFLIGMAWLLFFVLPILSMGLYAEERKRGTLELLATSPVTNWAVAVGKLLGVLTFFITMIVPLLGLEAIALSNTNPAIQPTIPLLGHLGLILLAATILSLGMFISSLTDSTIWSAVFTFAASLMLLLIPDFIAQKLGGSVGEFLGHLSLAKHYNNLVQGIFDTSSLILFASYIILGIFLTAQSIDALRFQRQ
ncbi:MAG: ABC transporter permease [Desmonostoc vinosum HA7617-LM4]|jgi:ABC-2 type transport system permease protein|nr:ABC transporter permease [Desmonostoc vinosum HA7617-LM4]